MATSHDFHPLVTVPQIVHQDLVLDNAEAKVNETTSLGLKRVAPYWHPYNTMAKGRWFNREILELVSTEFRDRSIEYYVRYLRNHFSTLYLQYLLII